MPRDFHTKSVFWYCGSCYGCDLKTFRKNRCMVKIMVEIEVEEKVI
jgi:hypothetical protein